MNIATPQNELYEKLLQLGWTLQKIEFKNGLYVAKAKNETTGQDIDRAGKSPEMALASVYQFAQRAYAVRRVAALRKLGAWTSDWLGQEQEIGQAYAKLPVFDEKAVPAWKALAAESKVQADAIRQQIKVEVTDDPEPYMSAQQMCEDVHKNKRFIVSRANSEHPVWTVEDNINFRIVHDVLGHCFAPGTMVRTRQGFKPIEAIEVGDEVLSGNGEWNRVYDVLVRDYDGPLVVIDTPVCANPIRVTPEHPVRALVGKHIRPHRTATCSVKDCVNKPHLHAVEWVKAGDLTSDNYLISAPQIPESVPMTSIEIPSEHVGPRSLPIAFELDDDFLWMIGMYLAEGSSDGSGKISFALHKDETEFFDRLMAFWTRYGFAPKERKEVADYNGRVLMVNSMMLASWLPAWLGRGSHNKAIPAELLNLPVEKLNPLLRGIMDGDGYQAVDRLEQTSPILALQVTEIGLRSGRMPSISTHQRIERKRVYTIHEASQTSKRRGTKRGFWLYLGNLAVALTSLESEHYSGKVYNLSVKNDPTYTVENVVVHNCQSGGDFSWVGENLACGVHFALISPLAREALFTECFTPETLVRTLDGLTPISEIRIGDYVLSGSGRFNRVYRTFEREHSDEILEIKTKAGDVIRVTPEHPFLKVVGDHPRKSKTLPCTKAHCHRYPECHYLDWIDAGHLREGDYLSLTVFDHPLDFETIHVPKRYHGKRKRHGPLAFDLTEDFLWMVGLYIAEGSSSSGSLSFGLHHDEKDYANRLVGLFESYGYTAQIWERGANALEVQVNSSVLAEWFRDWLGHGSHNKVIPAELLNLPMDKLTHVVNGIMDGDGHYRRNVLLQTSPILAQQMVEIGLRDGGFPSLTSRQFENKKDVYVVEGAVGTVERTSKMTPRGYWEVGGHKTVRIESIRRVPYIGKVYDLSVEDDPTFTVQNLTVHNCIGQQAYYRTFHGFGPQKVAFMSEFLHPVQEKEGEHVFVPHGGLPKLAPSPNMNEKGTMDQAVGMQGIFNSPGDWVQPSQFAAPQPAPPSHTFAMPGGVMEPFVVKTHEVEAAKMVSPDRPYDPNQFWSPAQTVPPIAGNQNDQDYIGIAETVDNAAKIDTGWPDEDEATQKRAIMNAFRVALLSPRKHLKWNAAHYQALMHADPSTPAVDLWDMLEAEREKHNQGLGYPEGSHLAYKRQLEFLAHELQVDNPSLSSAEALREAKEVIFNKIKEFEAQLGIDPANEGTSELRRYNMARKMTTEWLRENYTPLRGWQQGQMALAASFPIPQRAYEMAMYKHECPMCGGYLRDRGGIFSCSQCPFEYDAAAQSQSGMRTADLKDFYNDAADELENYAALARDVANTLPPEEWPVWVRNQIYKQMDNLPDHWATADQLFDTGNDWQPMDASGFSADDAKYGAFMGTHLDAIAEVGQHIDAIRDAAMRDLDEDGGKGFIFRNAVMNMNLKGVNPKVASFAWLLLAPMSSELGIIDTHVLRGLRRTERDMTPRDYYKLERMQRAAKDATGYSHMPLGLYHWGLWDQIRNPGEHSDHSPLRVLDPLPWDSPGAKWDAALNGKSGPWVGPQQFENARGHMERAARDFDTETAGQPANLIPLARSPFETLSYVKP